MVDVTEHRVVSRRRDFRLVRTQRVLQIILGLFWLLDAGLQFQPYMFSSNFTTTYLLNNAHNQPDIVRWIITNVGNFVGPHVAVWNTFFALIQVAIGLGLLFRRSVRPALFVSFFWAFGVWFFGEGLGLLFTGSASALTGAPGSVFLYGVIGLMAWPRTAPAEEDEETDPSVGIASSAAGQGPRQSDDASAGVVRVLVAGGDPVPPAQQPDPDVGLECDHGHVRWRAERVLPLSQQLWQSVRQWRRRDHVAAGHRLPDHRVRAARVPSTDAVPRRRWTLGGLLLGERPGSGRHLHGLGNRPELRSPCRAPRAWPYRCRAVLPDPSRLGSPRSRQTALFRAYPVSLVLRGAWWRSWPALFLSAVVIPSLPRNRPARPWPACPACPQRRRVRLGDLRRRPAARGGTTARRGRAWT